MSSSVFALLFSRAVGERGGGVVLLLELCGKVMLKHTAGPSF